jgi:hypothetical protein
MIQVQIYLNGWSTDCIFILESLFAAIVETFTSPTSKHTRPPSWILVNSKTIALGGVKTPTKFQIDPSNGLKFAAIKNAKVNSQRTSDNDFVAIGQHPRWRHKTVS